MDLRVEEAKAKRQCRVCGNTITKGTKCLKVVVNGLKFAYTGNICPPCLDMLNKQVHGAVMLPGAGFLPDGGISFGT